MTTELEPLNADLVRVLQSERARPAPSPAEVERVVQRVDLTFATAPHEPGAPAGGTTAVAGLARGAAAAWLGVGVLLGAVGGAQLQARYGAPAEAPPAPPPQERVAAPLVVHAPETARHMLAPNDVFPVVPPTLPPVDLTTPDEEHRLLEQAAEALSRGDAQAALEACEEHRHRYDESELAGERMSLLVRALVAQGRAFEARIRADMFRRAHPDSVHLVAIEEALVSAPRGLPR